MYQNESSIRESNIVADFCATEFVQGPQGQPQKKFVFFPKKFVHSNVHLWTLYLNKTLCIRTFICGRLQISQCRFNILSFEAISEKFWKAACTTLLLFGVFSHMEISVFNVEVCFTLFSFQSDPIGGLILSQSTVRLSLFFNLCGLKWSGKKG